MTMKKIVGVLFTMFLLLSSFIVFGETTEVSAGTETNYLTFTAEEANSWVNVNGISGTLKYSFNNGEWLDYTLNTQIDLTNIGDSVKFKGTEYKTRSDKYVTMGGKIAASGDVTSLINEVGGDATLSAEQFRYMFYKCTSLTSAPALPATTLTSNCYSSMFYGCTSLVTAPALQATTLAEYCYNGMFYGCTSLASAPALPATTLASNCYQSMFAGCTSLTSVSTLPATTLAEKCYYQMFSGCTSLASAPALSATTLANYCYQAMFKNCTSLVTAPALPATTLASNCYNAMFDGCTSLKTVQALPATTLAEYCYASMFYGCTSLETAPTLSATTLATYCCYQMFKNCTSLTSAPTLSAKTAASSCYYAMFEGCTSLVTAPTISATTLAVNCYLGMFRNCTSLVNAPTLPATSLKNSDCCYQSMFSGCTSLKTAPTLSAKTLSQHCYQSMFEGCTSLTAAPALPATTSLATSCYQAMFKGCTSLETAPTLSAKYLESKCYYEMFSGCTSLETAPALPATTLVNNCYQSMFSGCTSLKTAPALPATRVYQNSYYAMFSGCTSLETAPALPATTLANNCYQSMFEGCTSLVNAPALPATKAIQNCYRAMFKDCTSLVTAPTISATTLATCCYYAMFEGCTSLVNAPTLPVTALKGNCYYSMFEGCTSLVNAPALPATTLVTSCYYSMFSGCTSLVNAPALSATTLATSCYQSMFKNCTSLVNAPTLPATTLAMNCYYSMFSGCTSLVNAPALPATALGIQCYYSMFVGCTSLKTAPALPATTLTSNCYHAMFKNCTGLTTLPEIKATVYGADSCTSMFEGCSNIRLFESQQTNATEWSITITSAESSSFNSMFAGTGGAFTGTPVSEKTYYLVPITLTVEADKDNKELKYGSGSAKYNVTAGGFVTNPTSYTIDFYSDDKCTISASGLTGSYSNGVVTVTPTTANVGDYYMVLTSDAASGSIKSSAVKITINKVKVTVPTAKTGLIYHSLPQVGVELPQDAKYTLTGNTGTNADSYTATATLTDKTNYVWDLDTPTTDDQTIAWSIGKKAINVTAEDKTSNVGENILPLTYTNDALCGSDIFTGELSTNANKNTAGNYDIIQNTLKVNDGNNGNNYSITYTKGTYKVTSKTAQELSFVGITNNAVTKVYGDAKFTQKVSGNNTTVTYSSSDTTVATINSSTGEVTILKAGSTTITASAVEDSTYAAASKSYTLTVNKAKVTVPTAETNLVYTGNEQTGVILPQDAKYTLSINTATDAGDYTATATLTDKTNYIWDLDTPTSDDQSIAWNIAKKDQTLEFEDSTITKTVGDAKFTQKVTGAETAVTYSSDDQTIATVDSETGEVTILKAGNVTIIATVTDDANYNGEASYVLFICPKINSSKSNVIINGNKLSTTLTENNTSDCNIDFDMDISSDIETGSVDLVKNQDDTYSNQDSYGDEKIVVICGQDIIDPENYTITKGSIKITFKKSYLDTLAVGTHNFEINISDNNDHKFTYELTITIEEYKNVNTSVVTNNNASLKLVSLLSLITIAGVVILKKH